MDLPGFEYFEQNNMEQLFINSTNEQLQYFYNQRIFTWELVCKIDFRYLYPFQWLMNVFYDHHNTHKYFNFRKSKKKRELYWNLCSSTITNRPLTNYSVNQMASCMYSMKLPEATAATLSSLVNMMNFWSKYFRNLPLYFLDALANCPRGTRIRKATSTNFTVAHYCKKVEYNAQGIPKKNHDFLPPEMIETLRLSGNFVVKQLFANQFTRSGNLTISTDQNLAIFSGKRKKWGAALVSGDSKSRVNLIQN